MSPSRAPYLLSSCPLTPKGKFCKGEQCLLPEWRITLGAAVITDADRFSVTASKTHLSFPGTFPADLLSSNSTAMSCGLHHNRVREQNTKLCCSSSTLPAWETVDPIFSNLEVQQLTKVTKLRTVHRLMMARSCKSHWADITFSPKWYKTCV